MGVDATVLAVFNMPFSHALLLCMHIDMVTSYMVHYNTISQKEDMYERTYSSV